MRVAPNFIAFKELGRPGCTEIVLAKWLRRRWVVDVGLVLGWFRCCCGTSDRWMCMDAVLSKEALVEGIREKVEHFNTVFVVVEGEK